jgi:hypothetical protein
MYIQVVFKRMRYKVTRKILEERNHMARSLHQFFFPFLFPGEREVSPPRVCDAHDLQAHIQG